MIEVSAILPFGDDEELIGKAVSAVGNHLSRRGLSFELICIDLSSRDNSHAILALARHEWPQLRVMHANERRTALEQTVMTARGKWIWMTPAARVGSALPLFARLWRQIHEVDASLAVERPTSFLGRRIDLLPCSNALRGQTFTAAVKRFTKRAQQDGLTVVGSQVANQRRLVPKLRFLAS